MIPTTNPFGLLLVIYLTAKKLSGTALLFVAVMVARNVCAFALTDNPLGAVSLPDAARNGAP
jgi:hypothetical protein